MVLLKYLLLSSSALRSALRSYPRIVSVPVSLGFFYKRLKVGSRETAVQAIEIASKRNERSKRSERRERRDRRTKKG